MSAERFKCASVTGWPIVQGVSGGPGSTKPGTSYSILDTAVCHREVASWGSRFGEKHAREMAAILNEGKPMPWWDGHAWSFEPRADWHLRDHPNWPFL